MSHQVITKKNTDRLEEALTRLTTSVRDVGYLKDKTEELSAHLANLGSLQTILHTYSWLLLNTNKVDIDF